MSKALSLIERVVDNILRTGTSRKQVREQIVTQCNVPAGEVMVEFVHGNAAMAVIEGTRDRRRVFVARYPERRRGKDRRKRPRKGNES